MSLPYRFLTAFFALALPLWAVQAAPASAASTAAAANSAMAPATPASTAPAAASSAVSLAAPSQPGIVGTQGNSTQVLDRIVAIVNKGVILESELVHHIVLAQSQMQARDLNPPPANALQGQVLQHMIMTRLQLQRAAEDGIKVDDSDVNNALERLAKQNNVSVAKLSQAALKEGISLADLRENIKDRIIIQKLQRKEIAKHINVTDQDIDLFLANQAGKNGVQYRLSHILVSVPHDATKAERDKAKAKADMILAKLRAGKKFAQVAIRYSDGQQALQGGELGWRDADDVPGIFADVVPGLKVGQFSDVIDALNGYNIVRLDDKRTQGPRKKVVETHALEIMLKPGPLRDAAATRKLAHTLYQNLQGGADFNKLAKENSDDLNSKNEGGDLGWQLPGTSAPEVQKHLDALDKGQVSTPFQSDGKWYIVKRLGQRTVDVTDKIRRNRARMAIMEQRAESKYQSWLLRLRAQAYIDVRLKPGMITDAEVSAASQARG